jgi:hypothetical protein
VMPLSPVLPLSPVIPLSPVRVLPRPPIIVRQPSPIIHRRRQAVIVPAAPVPWVYIPLRKPIRLFGWGW